MIELFDDSCNESSRNGHKSYLIAIGSIRSNHIRYDGTPYEVKVSCTVWSGGKFLKNYLSLSRLHVREICTVMPMDTPEMIRVRRLAA